MKAILLVATWWCVAACDTKAGAQPTVGARKAALASQCVGQGGQPKVESDGVVCEVPSGIRWKVEIR